MTDYQFSTYVEIIRRCRDIDQLTNAEIALRCGSSKENIWAYTKAMVNMGCLVKVGSIRSKQGHPAPLFAVSPHAVTRLYQHRNESRRKADPPVIQEVVIPEEQPKCIEFCGKVVSKAYITPDFGWSEITRIDAMLREVRCGMPTMQ